MKELLFSTSSILLLLFVLSLASIVAAEKGALAAERTQAEKEADVEAAIQSPDPRVKIMCLFSHITSGLHESWTMKMNIEFWHLIKLDETNTHVVEIVVEDNEDAETRRMLKGYMNLEALRKLDKLFPELWLLDLSGHLLEGEFDFNHLPPKLEVLNVRRWTRDRVHLHGTLDASKLPSTLTELNVMWNGFTGEIDWKALGRMQNLDILSLSFNHFTGPVEWEHLPGAMTSLWINNNNFSGSVELSTLPPRVTSVYLFGNKGLKFLGDVRNFPQAYQLDEVSVTHLANITVTVAGGAGGVIGGDEFHRRLVENRANEQKAASERKKQEASASKSHGGDL